MLLLGNQGVDFPSLVVEEGENRFLIFNRWQSNMDTLENVPIDRCAMLKNSIPERLSVCLKSSVLKYTECKASFYTVKAWRRTI